jgi:hypothetical protein
MKALDHALGDTTSHDRHRLDLDAIALGERLRTCFG